MKVFIIVLTTFLYSQLQAATVYGYPAVTKCSEYLLNDEPALAKGFKKRVVSSWLGGYLSALSMEGHIGEISQSEFEKKIEINCKRNPNKLLYQVINMLKDSF
jgi:hypothetical protein